MAPLRSLPTRDSTIGIFFDIGQGAGLAASTGIRPFLPPLLAGALANADLGIDFDGTDFAFLERPGFLAIVLALAALEYVSGRFQMARNHRALRFTTAVAAFMLGGLLFAGSLAEGGEESWPGLVAGGACAALAYASVALLFERARRRLDDQSAALTSVYADGLGLVSTALAIAVPPAGFLMLAVLAWTLVRRSRDGGGKYAGLRILR